MAIVYFPGLDFALAARRVDLAAKPGIVLREASIKAEGRHDGNRISDYDSPGTAGVQDLGRCELIRGELSMMSPAGF